MLGVSLHNDGLVGEDVVFGGFGGTEAGVFFDKWFERRFHPINSWAWF